MRAVFLFAGALLISIGCVSGQSTEFEVNINNSTDYPEFPEVSTVSEVPTTKNVPTTEAPTTTVEPNSTTTSPVTPNTTTTVVPTPPSTTPKSTTAEPPKPPVTTEVPHSSTVEPTPKERHFDGASFLGGIILAVGLMAIGLVVFKFYKARAERNYHTL